MPGKRTCVLAVLALLATPPLTAQAVDPEVAKGIRLVDDGDFDAAIVTLDAAARRLASSPGRAGDLAQAYLYLGVAYLGKGHETSAKARFRDALAQVRDLNLTPDRFAPKVIEVFEKAREEAERAGTAPAAKAAPPEKGKGGGKRGLILLGLGGAAAAGVGVAVAGGGGGDDGGGLKETVFPNETVVFGGGRDFVVEVGGSGTLTAKVTWDQQGVVLSMYIVSLANPGQVLAEALQSGTREAMLSLAVTAGSYRISVTNSTGMGPMVTTTFTLRVTHP